MDKSATDWLHAPGPSSPGMKIGLLGGSFNPAHEGHLHISDMALKQLGLDYVWWLVAPQNPLKPKIGMAPLSQRLSYAAHKYEHHPRIIVVDVETALRTRYTIDTVKALQKRFPGVRFVWLMGSDNLSTFHRWRNWREIAARVPIAVVMRPGSTRAALFAKTSHTLAKARRCPSRAFAASRPPAFAILDGKRCPISATAIRAKTVLDEALVHAIPPC